MPPRNPRNVSMTALDLNNDLRCNLQAVIRSVAMIFQHLGKFLPCRHGLIALVLLVGANLAEARILSDEEVSALSLEQLLEVEVYSTTRYVQALAQTPSSATVIGSEEIKAYGYRSLTDILKSISGLYVTNDRNYSYLGSRGFGSVGDWNSRVLFLVDGNRVNENIYDGAYIGQDFIVDVALIDRVEYVAGPSAAMFYGSNAIFGVVNVITKTGLQMNGAELSAGVGSPSTRYSRMSWGKKTEDGLDVLLSASRFKDGGRDLYLPEFGGTAIGLDHERADRLFAKFGLGEFSLEIARSERTKGIPNASYGQVFNDPRSLTQDNQTLVDLKYNHALAADSAVSGRVFYGQYDYTGDYVYDLAAAPPPSEIGIFHDLANGQWWGADIKFVSGSRNGHKFLLGADWQRDLKRNQKGGYLGQPSILDDLRHGQHWGMYVHDEISLSEALTLNVGGRYDQLSVGKGELHPRLGLIHAWNQDTAIKALYGSSFRPPNVFELYYDSGDGAFPNAQLQPERIQTYELVLDHGLSTRDRLIATLFHNNIRKLIEYVPQAGLDGSFGTEDDFSMLQNARNVHSMGLELRFERALDDGGHFRASYTGQRTQDEDGATLENSPRHLVKLNWRQPVFNRAFQAGLELQYASARNTYAGTQVPGSTLVNLTVSNIRLARNLDLSGTVANLFNQHVADPAAYFHAPLDRIPQDGREWRLLVNYRF